MKKRRRPVIVITGFALILGMVFLYHGYQTTGVELYKREVSLERYYYDRIDVRSFLTYEGTVYTRYFAPDTGKALRGEYLGEVLPVNMVEGWKQGDPYPDFVTFSPGKVYTVRGYDPQFLLAVDTLAYELELYYCPRLDKVRTGREIFGKQFHLREKMKTLILWKNVNDVIEQRKIDIDACRNLMNRVVKELMRARFEPFDPAECPGQFSVWLEDENGLPVGLEIREQGYVQFLPLFTKESAALKLQEDTYRELEAFLNDLKDHPDWKLNSLNVE